jgi:hypothetical protein
LAGAENARAIGVDAGLENERYNLWRERCFDYINAVPHCPTYRTRYGEFLNSDFPRIPLSLELKLFRVLCDLGADRVALHLMELGRLEKLITTFPEKGSNVIEKVLYERGKRRVWIRDSQCPEGVPQEVWELRIGRYQVCERWLKDRNGRFLR